ncbi:hypothetical protein WOSG25_080210 [Weissella oryzae SG25]|uniref:Alkaline shock response membrane anchor protein AmaP n=1 Tax=Weissella oryzae (strain DSM 25784 / JCM 18191 / LMG 30913 / SG25) TaxID=1329250 RepID=A0A069CUN4_WEIOS|nr:alkaline shock response membrane anchor protein AmaP [Weissella oryzae]GAK31189.1 hypothetical protein WOSG25_080210 [Weissella oryzae SG25]
MRIWHKLVILVLTLLYVLPFLVIIWRPESRIVIHQLNIGLKKIGLNNLSVANIAYYYAIVLALLLVIGAIIILFWPTKKDDVTLIRDKTGSLTLDNRGITGFVKRSLSGSGLTDIDVKIKNHRRKVNLIVRAKTPYQQAMLANLGTIKMQLEDGLQALLKDTGVARIETKLIVDQANQSKKRTRVV